MLSEAQVEETEGGFLVRKVTGSAQIYEDKAELAKDAAVKIALNRAVERTVGVHLKSDRLTVDATMLSSIIQAHSRGYAKLLEHVKPSWREEDTMRVMINVWVSKQVPDEVYKKLIDPKGVLVYIPESVTDRRSDQTEKPFIRNELQTQIQQSLGDKGYKVWFLPETEGKKILKALEGYAVGNTYDILNAESRSLIESIGLRELADVFIVGHMDIKLRDFRGSSQFGTIKGAKTAETVTRLQLLRIDSSTNRVQVYPLKAIIERESDGQVDRVIQYAAKATVDDAEALFDQLEKWTGPPNRLVQIFVEGLPSLCVYEDLVNELRQYSGFGIEKVRGHFDENISRITVTFSEQSLAHGDLTKQVKYLASVLDEKQNYKVISENSRTIFLRYVE